MKQTILSAQQSELLENLIVKYGQMVNFQQILETNKGIQDYQQTKNLITKLVHTGWLIRIKRGLYAISDLSSRGFLTLSNYAIAHLLVQDSYVSFESALAYYHMFDQLTDKTISISLKAYKSVKLAAMEYSFIKTKTHLYFGWQEVIIDNQNTKIATAEKALIDMVHFHKNKLAIDIVIEKVKEYKDELNHARFIEYLSKFSTTTIKIFGFIFDLLSIDTNELHKFIKNNHGTHWMTVHDKKFNAKWRLYYDEYFDKYQQI